MKNEDEANKQYIRQLCSTPELEEKRRKILSGRIEKFKQKGCGYWTETNKIKCSFPYCFCYPYWQEKYQNEKRS